MMDRLLTLVKNARVLRHFNRTMTIVCASMMPLGAWLYFVHRRTFDAISILTLAEITFYNTAQGHFGAWQTSRAEEAAERSGKG